MVKSRKQVDEALRFVHVQNLTTDELIQLRDALSGMIDARLRVQNEAETPKTRTLNATRSTPQGSFERKTINGYGPYLYLRWWSGGRHKSTYLGKVNEQP